jgi:hypothetical protein
LVQKSFAAEGVPIVPVAASDGLYGPFGASWIGEALTLGDAVLLRCVGLDKYNYVLLLGAHIIGLGSVLAAALVVASTTGTARRENATQFNRLTLARVDNGSNWLVWVASVVGTPLPHLNCANFGMNGPVQSKSGHVRCLGRSRHAQRGAVHGAAQGSLPE